MKAIESMKNPHRRTKHKSISTVPIKPVKPTYLQKPQRKEHAHTSCWCLKIPSDY